MLSYSGDGARVSRVWCSISGVKIRQGPPVPAGGERRPVLLGRFPSSLPAALHDKHGWGVRHGEGRGE
ncbi:hypothetical protein ColLi_09519 [Colletotrichum liriopes]|uniref:Uncharacterized protein n=1 Tax=Colletotrichum liriopes TaxID=708192 RepID=A0AA37LWE1_9PEZI|nr:hypothetical protein ColLi_09519 [Colletotrichum liriopes]